MKRDKGLTFFHVLFLLEDFPSFYCDEGISFFTQTEHGDSSHSCPDYRLQSLCRTKDTKSLDVVKMVTQRL